MDRLPDITMPAEEERRKKTQQERTRKESGYKRICRADSK